MNICQAFHTEIAFEGKHCPLCSEIEAHAECQETSDRKTERIQELLDERDAYRSELRL